jgi:hypothetical protein
MARVNPPSTGAGTPASSFAERDEPSTARQPARAFNLPDEEQLALPVTWIADVDAGLLTLWQVT